MRQIDYYIFDVFTEKALAGNPLAVVMDADGLSDTQMQAIAREFNLSETIFFRAPKDAAHSASVRIFMPIGELPFAGHPTVGGAIAFAGLNGIADDAIVLEEGVGPVHCKVKADRNGGHASFVVPRLSRQQPLAASTSEIAKAMGIDLDDVGFGEHKVSLWSAGVPYVMLPVKSVDVLAQLRLDAEKWLSFDVRRDGKVAAAYVYAPSGKGDSPELRSRMFAPWDGMPEDPATGSAAAALSGAYWQAEGFKGGSHALTIHQGVEMGRPSRIELLMEGEGGQLTRATISGNAVKVAEGKMFLDL